MCKWLTKSAVIQFHKSLFFLVFCKRWICKKKLLNKGKTINFILFADPSSKQYQWYTFQIIYSLLLHTFQTIYSLLLRLIHLTLTVRKAYKEITQPYLITTYCNTSRSETDEFESSELLEPLLHVCSTIFLLNEIL